MTAAADAEASVSPLLVAFQGGEGSYSHIAARAVFPDCRIVPTSTFEDAFIALERQDADVVIAPVENSAIGRIADVLRLLAERAVTIDGEHFLRVEHHLMAPPGADRETLRRVHSQPPALSQCRNLIQRLGLEVIAAADTAGAARLVARRNSREDAAIASQLAAEVNGLNILIANVEDQPDNVTRFFILKRETPLPERSPRQEGEIITAFLFRVRNVPASLYKALGGFATNGVNMVKLESCPFEGSFEATRFFAEIVGHPDDDDARLAFDELRFFASDLRILGVYRRGEEPKKIPPPP